MRKFPLLALTLIVALLGPAAIASAKTKPKPKPKTSYYLALGDSLAAGIQEDPTGTSFLSENKYVNQVYAKAKKKFKKLKLVNLGCPGESLKTFADGGCPFPLSEKQKTSQLKQAQAFLKKNAKRTKLITISLGANEVTPCAKGTAVDIDCVLAGVGSLRQRMPVVAAALRKAAGKKVKIAIQTQYNPFLALYLQGGPYKDLALASVDLARGLNSTITEGVAKQKFLIADVATAFKSSDLTTMVPFNGGQVPVAVAQTCALTQICLPAPQGNIHPSDAGYTLIAKTFEKALKI